MQRQIQIVSAERENDGQGGQDHRGCLESEDHGT